MRNAKTRNAVVRIRPERAMVADRLGN